MSRVKPTYDEVCVYLCEHREEMRLLYAFLDSHALMGDFNEELLDETGNTGFSLEHLPWLDPEGGEAPEFTRWKAKAEQARSEMRFVLAVQALAKAKAPEPPAKRPRTLAMGVGKGRGAR
jgi:hypothetical protein